LAFLCLGIFMMAGAISMEYYTDLGPGPGFFPFWLGLILALLTVLWLVRVMLGPVEPLPPGFIPSRSGALRFAGVLAALIFYVLFSDLLGFRLAMLAFLLFVLYGPGRQSALVSIAIGLLGSFGAYFLFHDLLGTHLPLAGLGILEDLGL
jgi:putative tricarboxylic transport membrane protein